MSHCEFVPAAIAPETVHRVEHIEMISEADIPRFAELGVVASMQPLHSPIEEDDSDFEQIALLIDQGASLFSAYDIEQDDGWGYMETVNSFQKDKKKT